MFHRIVVSTASRPPKYLGYSTGMVGKWHNGAHDMRYHPNARGFDEFAGFLHGGMDYWNWALDYNGSPRSSDGRYLTEVFTAEAVSFIDRHRNEAFFLYVAYNAPHGPLEAPDQLLRKHKQFSDLTPAVAAVYAMIEAMDSGVGQILERLEMHGIEENTAVLFTSDNGPHMGGTGTECLGRYNGPFSGSKGSSREGGIRVPAILHWPAQIRPQREPRSALELAGGEEQAPSQPLVHFVDWYPTLCQIAGGAPLSIEAHQVIPGGKPVDGYGMLPVLAGGAAQLQQRPQRFWQRNRYRRLGATNAAIRDSRWKLYWPTAPGSESKLQVDTEVYKQGLERPHNLTPIDKTLPEREILTPVTPMLFDISNDPGETEDVADEHSGRVHRMTEAWNDWFEGVYADWRNAWHRL